MLKRLAIFSIIIISLALISIYLPDIKNLTSNTIHSINPNQKQTTQVIKIIDGDTIETTNPQNPSTTQTIRLLGINTPEKNQPYYHEAKTFLNKLQNQTIQIQQDKEDLDKYQRKLRYIYYNNKLINLQIIEQGLATTFMTENLIYKNQFQRAEEQAKIQQINLWKKSTQPCANCIQLQELNSEEEFFIIQNICNHLCPLTSWTVKDNANHITKLQSLKPLHQQTYNSKGKIWNNDGDRFFMRDNQGSLVIFYEY
jgi:micrococcal nuclease